MKPLTDIQILDFTRLLPGPLGTHLLAEMGAEVIKIERSSSPDYIREQPPFVDGISTLYYALNCYKNQLTIDFDKEAGRAQLIQLIQESDLLIEQFRPNVMAHWGLDYATLKNINPQLIYVSLSGYGQTGPHSQDAGHDLNYLAISGALDLLRDEAGKPIIPGFQLADIAGGAYRLQSACLAALLERHRTGEGTYVDVSMTDGVVPLLTFPLTQFWGGFDPREMRILSGGLVNYNVYQASDGRWLALGALELKFWNAFCAAVARPKWQRKQIFELSVHTFPKTELESLFLTRSRDEWAAWAAGKDLCLTPVVELQELEESAHIKARQLLVSMPTGMKTLKGNF